jgi:hypothetical protein
MPEASSTLCLHAGARHVSPEELAQVKAPPPQGRWYPLSHGSVLTRVRETLGEAGYVVRREQLGLSRNDARFFGVLDLGTALTSGVSLAVGVRNSTDKSFPLGFAAGSRVFCCDNLAFRAELLVRKKHTRYGEQRFAQAIAEAVTRLSDFREAEGTRIKAMQQREVTAPVADSLILRAFEKGIVTAPLLPRVIKEWREPAFDEFRERTYWSLFNSFTAVLGERARTNPHGFAVTTMRLSAHLDPAAGEPLHVIPA